MKVFPVTFWIAALFFSVCVTIPFLSSNREPTSDPATLSHLEVSASVDEEGYFQVYWSDGQGYSEENSTRRLFQGSGKPERFTLDIPAGQSVLRIDPIDRPTRVVFHTLRWIRRDGAEPVNLLAGRLRVLHQVEELRSTDEGTSIVVSAGGFDPQLEANVSADLAAELLAKDPIKEVFRLAWPILVTVLALRAFFYWRRKQVNLSVSKIWVWGQSHPVRFLAALSLVATLLSAYPVVFLGKSFVSPNLGGAPLLYADFPTLPGNNDRIVTKVEGADIGAMMWAFLPYGRLHREAYLHGELPLWNRYNACGVSLLGQGQSMVGDPLMLFVNAVGGPAWAWDLRFVVDRWYFAFALGLCVWLLTRQMGAAAVVAFGALFIGFFNFRVNHPAVFSLCEAPGVLLGWLLFLTADRPSRQRWGLVAMIVSHVLIITSGTVKEAYLLMLTMDLAGALILLFSKDRAPQKLLRLGLAAAAGTVVVLLTAPSWLVFYLQLQKAYTTYNAAYTVQIQPSMLLGFMDEVFYRPLSKAEYTFNPSINFLFFIGLAYAFATVRTSLANPAFKGLLLAAVLPAALVFGVIPPAWIIKTPFLANVGHVDNTFSCALIVLAIVMAGIGFAAAGRRLGTTLARQDIAIVAMIVGAVVCLWIGAGQAVHRVQGGPVFTFSPLKTPHDYTTSPFVWLTLLSLLLAGFGGLGVIHHALKRRALGSAGVVLIATFTLFIIWRHTLHHPKVGFHTFATHAPNRVDFSVPSTAVEAVRATQASTPSRAMGLGNNFFPGYNAMLGIETIHGPEALVNPYLRDLSLVSGLRRPWEWRFDLAPAEVASARPFLDFLNVRYYLDAGAERKLMRSALKPVVSADLDVYESPTVWPRAFFTGRILTYDNVPTLMAAIREGKGPFAAVASEDLRKDDYVQLHLLATPQGAQSQPIQPATNYRLGPNRTAFTIQASDPGVAVLQETFHRKDFRATVDGVAAPVLRINHAFKGVYIAKPGSHRVEISYHPAGYTASLGLFFLGLGLFVLGFLVHRRFPPTLESEPTTS